MVKQIPCYEDSSGVIHRKPFDAHRADLALMLGRSEDVSETSAKKLAERFANDGKETEELIEALKQVQQHRPAPVTERNECE